MTTYVKTARGYAGVDPNVPNVVYDDRPVGSLWEEMLLVQEGPEGWFNLTANAAKKRICLNKNTHKLEVRDNPTGWGNQWAKVTDASGKSHLICDTFTMDVEEVGSVSSSGPAESFVIKRRDFVRPNGERRVLRGCDAFMAFRIFLDQGAAGLQKFFNESRRLGFDMWRVFFQGAISQNQVMELHPSEYTPDQIHAFGVLLNANGITPLATCFVDNQVIKAGVDQWFKMTDALEGLVALASAGNEFQKNGFDPYALPKPHGSIYWSRGSSTGDPDPYVPYPNGASFIEFHPNRDLVRGLMDATASPLTLWDKDKIDVPLIVDEPARFGTSGHAAEFADPAWGRAYGQVYSAMQAGTVFHNWFGQRGLTMDDPTIAVAQAWQKGMTV